jgi:DNA-binding transcriptional MerR regulator
VLVSIASETIGAGEAARRLGVSAEYLRFLARAGRVPFEQSPYGRVYDSREIDALKEERERAHAAEAA